MPDVLISGTPTEGETLTATITSGSSPSPPTEIPEGSRFFGGYEWRYLFTDLESVTTTFAEGICTGRRVTFTQGEGETIEGTVVPDDPRINTIWDDGYPNVAPSKRLVYAFRREVGGSPLWRCRAAGILMSPEDEADSDLPVSRFTAYGARKYLDARPIMNAAGELPDEQGYLPLAGTGDAIICELLANTIASEGSVHIDAGAAFGGTVFWGGTIEETDPIDIRFQQGEMIGEAWSQIEEAGNCDIILDPIYDPVNRPGYTHELSILASGGSDRHGAVFGWDRMNRCVASISRSHDATPGAFFNRIQYYSGQGGGIPVPALGPLDNIPSIDDFGVWWAQQFFPTLTSTDPTGAAVLALARLALRKAKQGKRTMTITTIPTRSPIPLLQYGLLDRVPIYASARLRVTADGLQQVIGLPIEIDDDGVEHVAGFVATPDWNDGS